MAEHRGAHKVEQKNLNRSLVRYWMFRNPNGTKAQAQLDLKLSYPTIKGHMDAINAEHEEAEKHE